MFHRTRPNLLLGAAGSLFWRWKHLWRTQRNVRLPAEPRCALKLLREELPFHLHCWRAMKHFSTPLPNSENSSSSFLQPHHASGMGHDQGDALQATWMKPSRIFTPYFQWTTDWALKTFLDGRDIQDGHPTSSQQAKKLSSEAVLLSWSRHACLIKGKIKTCGCLP